MPTGAETDQWLTRVFSSTDPQSLAANYDSWAGCYDADMLAVGYMNPAIAAGFLGRHVVDRSGPILDAGVGSGVMGEVFHIMGYRGLAGIDISEGMLAQARNRGVYDDLRNRMLGGPLDYADAYFGAVVSIGVFALGHAPSAALDELVRITRSGGQLIMTIATRAWEDGGFSEKVEELQAAGRWRLTEVTEPYRPMPLSPTKGDLTTRMFAFQVT